MKIDLSTKTALVTGASSGIGKVIAEKLAEAGASVLLCARNWEKLEEAQRDLSTHSDRIEIFQLDVTDPESVRQLFTTQLAHRTLDILVNNAGNVKKFGGFFDLSDDDWHDAFDMSCMSAVHCIREAYPLLRRSRAGRIINISSLPARQPGAWNPHYSAAKAGLENISKHCANQFAKDGITVNVVRPSTIKGGGWDKNVRDRALRDSTSKEVAESTMTEEEKKKNPMERVGTPLDVANAVLYLVSDQANFITGQCINVDGGTMRTMS